MKSIPKPQKCDKLGGVFTITNETVFFCDERFVKQAKRFAQIVQESCGFAPSFTDEISHAHVIFTYNEKCRSEEYYLMIAEGLATVSASDEKGCFYAVETLRQLFAADFPHETLCCNNCYIQDSPKFSYRGLSVDICRHFFPVEVLKQIVELMSRVKLNKLHLHLSDDQGFRLEIKKYPLLNSVSCHRDGSEVVENGKRFVDDVPVDGYLTAADVKELVSYAAERQIDVIPEIDIPGHAVAMLAAYPQFSCEGAELAVRKKWGISKDILCAGNEETYEFVKDILDEVCQLFPSEYIHLGGDEVPKDRWCNCKKCREKLSELKLANFDQLQTYMVEQFRRYLQEKGKTVICWNDGVAKNASLEIVSQVWKPFTRGKGAMQANKNRKVIMSPFFRMYFDYPYAMTPLKKSLRFNPLKGVKKSKQKYVLGVEGTIWTEYISSKEKLFFNLLPRMAALAECGWGNVGRDFAKRLNSYTALYDKMGLVYNKHTSHGVRNAVNIRAFFKTDPDVELNKQNKSEKQTEKEQ